MPLPFLASVLVVGVACAKAAKLPDIVVVVADDLGSYDVSEFRGGAMHTPVLDALAKDGLVFETHYVFQICAPTRSSLLTGRYPFHVAQSLPEG